MFTMRTSLRVLAIALVVAATLVLSSEAIRAQVTTATLYGVVQDSSGAILPGVNVVVTHQGTNLTRETVSDARGEFALPALPAGPYAIKIELTGFKTYESRGLTLSAGQTIRQTYSLEVGTLAETVTVAEAAPLVQTSSTAQVQSISDVTEIPVSRRNLQNVVMLAPGVASNDGAQAGGRAFRVNGVGDGGSSVTVDGSNAQAGMENRGMGNHGAHNQIEIMSMEAVAEVQVVRGVLNAEYGGSIGGQVNMITRSGTNQFHGSSGREFPARCVCVARSVPASHDRETRGPVQPVWRIDRRTDHAEPAPVLRDLRRVSREFRRDATGERPHAGDPRSHHGGAAVPRDETGPGPSAAAKCAHQRGQRPVRRRQASDPTRQHVPGQSGFRDRPRQTVGDRVPDQAVRARSIGPQRQ